MGIDLVFVIGTGRCGSTLVHEVLARQEEFGFVSNIEDNFPVVNRLGRWNSRFYRSPLGMRTRKGGLRFAPSEAYRIISREVSPIYANSCRDLVAADATPWLRQRFRRFFEDRAAAQGRVAFLHKYTGWSRIGFFHEIFPAAKFIHIVRDGRAVANSWLQMPWWGGYRGPENWLWGLLPPELDALWQESCRSFPVLAAIGWRILMESIRESARRLPESQYKELRYEDVLEDPRGRFEEMLAFCGREWTPKFERWFARQVFSKGRRHAWKRDLEPEQVAAMERVIGLLLAEYGYE